MLLALFVLPLIAGLISFLIQSDAARRGLLVVTALAHLTCTALSWLPQYRDDSWMDNAFLLDDLGRYFLTIVSILFCSSAVYVLNYLRVEKKAPVHSDLKEKFMFSNSPEQIFVGCLLLFLASMTFVTCCNNLGLLWVGIEATTLVSAPMIYFHRHHRSLEATWKYLLICSVGIAMALMGNFLLSVANVGEKTDFTLTELIRRAPHMNIAWLEASFLFLLVGYGTKMGLAPMHTWLPDAHSEAPSAVSALLSGALLNCAFLGILRAVQICSAAGVGDFARDLLLWFGIFSMLVAAVFIVGQSDFKRMLAYSSVEHMGILAVGVGLGGIGAFGTMFHALNHSLTKACLFLVAGNIMAVYKTKNIHDVHSLFRVMPISGTLWMMGFLSIVGFPPFGTFLSEFTILQAAIDQDRYVVVVLYLALLGLIFIGLVDNFLKMSFFGRDRIPLPNNPLKESWLSVVPPAILCILFMTLGLYVPTQLTEYIQSVAKLISRST